MKQEYKALYEKFGLNVGYYRKRKRLTQLQLAELVDIDRSHISAIELGNVGVSLDVISGCVRFWKSRRRSCLIFDEYTVRGETFRSSNQDIVLFMI